MRAIPGEALSPLIVAGRDTDRAVDVEVVAGRREAALSPIEVGVWVALEAPRPREECTTGEGELGAGFERRGLRAVVGPVLGRALIDVALAPEPPDRAVAHAPGYQGDIVSARRRAGDRTPA